MPQTQKPDPRVTDQADADEPADHDPLPEWVDDGVWQPRRGRLMRLVAWVILAMIGLGIAAMLATVMGH